MAASAPTSTTAPATPAIAPMAAGLSEDDELAEIEAEAIAEMDGMAEPGTRAADADDDGTSAATGGLVSLATGEARVVGARAAVVGSSRAVVRVGLGSAVVRVTRRAVVCMRELVAAPSVARTVLSAMMRWIERAKSVRRLERWDDERRDEASGSPGRRKPQATSRRRRRAAVKPASRRNERDASTKA